MTKEMLYEILEDVDEKYVEEARVPQKKKRPLWVKWGVLAACLCLVIGIGIQVGNWNENGGAGFFGNGDNTVLEPHPEDFSSDIEEEILAQFDNEPEVKKVYLVLTNEWFLSKEISDFSQVVTTDIVYVVPGGSEGDEVEDAEKDGFENKYAYSAYTVNEEGSIEWDYSVYPPKDASIPYGLCGLTFEMIESDLAGLEYEDYIVTYTPRLDIVFVWVRAGEGDMLLTYLSRPDLLGMENRQIYTLQEVQEILTEAYKQ